MNIYPDDGEPCALCGSTPHARDCPWHPRRLYAHYCTAICVLRALYDEAAQHHAARMPEGAPPSAALAAAAALLEDDV